MKQSKTYCVYILANTYNTTIYIGVTSNLEARMYQHKNKLLPGFTARYNLNKLIYVETTEDIMSALNREKEIKKWRRSKKNTLITKKNPKWKDLSKEILN